MGTAIISAVKGNVSGRKALRLLDHLVAPPRRMNAALRRGSPPLRQHRHSCQNCRATLEWSSPKLRDLPLGSNNVRFQGVAKSSSVTDTGAKPSCRDLAVSGTAAF